MEGEKSESRHHQRSASQATSRKSWFRQCNIQRDVVITPFLPLVFGPTARSNVQDLQASPCPQHGSTMPPGPSNQDINKKMMWWLHDTGNQDVTVSSDPKCKMHKERERERETKKKTHAHVWTEKYKLNRKT